VPVRRIFRWLIALGVTTASFTVILWIADAWGGLDRATALTLAIAAAPLLAGPFAWWASQPIETHPDRRHRGAPAIGTDPSGAPGGVFVCYSQADGNAYAGQLKAFLETSGVPAWLDREIITGQRWTQVIEHQLELCAAVVVVMTPAANQSEWVDREIAHARAAGKPILPVLLAGRPFFSLANLQYENVTDGAMPSPDFVSRLRSITEATATSEHPAVGTPQPEVEPKPALGPKAASPVPVAPSPKVEPTTPNLTGADRSRRKRMLVVAVALMLVVISGTVTAIVVSSSNGKDTATSSGSGSGSPDYPFWAPGLAISSDGQWLYVTWNYAIRAENGSQQWISDLVAIDTQTRVAGASFGGFAPGAGDAVTTPDGHQVYIASDTYDGVAVIGTRGGSLFGITGLDLTSTPSAPLGGASSAGGSSQGHRSLALSPDGQRIYLADEHASVVLVADRTPDKPDGSVKVIKVRSPRDVEVSPDGKRLYVVGGSPEGLVYVIDTGTGTVIREIHVGEGPRSVAISRDGTRLYVANWLSATISVIDTSSATVSREFKPACGYAPIGLAVGRDANRVYITCQTSNVVVAMDGASGATIDNPVTVGRLPSRMLLSPDGSRLYVATIETETVNVTVIDTATNTTIGAPIVAGRWLVHDAPSAAASTH